MGSEQIVIPARYCGPPQSGNGGYSCGVLANFIDGPAAVRLKAPPPLDVQMSVERDGDVVRLLRDDGIIAEARSCELEMDIPDLPDMACAMAATARFPEHFGQYFPTCFVCGTKRPGNDGMRILPGVARADGVMAAPWTPGDLWADEAGHVRPEFIWSALDCPGGFAVMGDGLADGVSVLLGEMRAAIDAPVRASDRCIVMAWSIQREGRKRFAGTALINEAGKVVARARQTWVEVLSSSIPGMKPLPRP
jgi:hypothetical protein